MIKKTRNKNTSQIIKALRVDHDLLQFDVAEILDTSQTMYSNYERGINELYTKHIIRLSEYYNSSADYILGLTNKKERIK